MELLYTITAVKMSYELINPIENLLTKRKQQISEYSFQYFKEKFKEIIE